MRPNVRIFDEQTIDSLPWRDTSCDDRLRRYLVAFIRNGPRNFIDNADVRMRALQVDRKVMPLVVADSTRGNSNLCSLTSHYVDYARMEMGKPGLPVYSRRLRKVLSLVHVPLRLFDVDRVVYVNNWLWPTNPAVRLTGEEIAALTSHLAREFPDRAIVFRSVNALTCRPLLRTLQACGYGTVASRKIYILVPGPAAHAKEDLRRDLKLLQKTSYAVLRNRDLAASDASRLAQLYRTLYLEKYPCLNAQYNEKFFRCMLQEDILDFHALKKDGSIVAFCGSFSRDGVINPPMIGYDLTQPRKLGLYRLAFAMLIREATDRGICLNLSSGAGEFKLHRGGRPTVEFDAVYDAHLALHRRIPWWVLRGIFNARTLQTFGE